MKRIRKGTIAIQKPRRHISMQKLAPVGILLVLVVVIAVYSLTLKHTDASGQIFTLEFY